MIIALLLAASAAAADFSVKPGLDARSLGGIVVHDFKTEGTISGLQWDALHILYKGDIEVAELGAFGARRDGDRHILVGPSFGTPGGDLAGVACWLQDHDVDWAWLKVASGYGRYVHAYVNIGWDFSMAAKMKLSPDLVGLGGVLKFGGDK